ncbi:MAG: hypothetical protein JXX14_11785 [Deltaproteobacteria bacterium]|nr:hypothetical protein [Deltaproteobacteria bacterium]
MTEDTHSRFCRISARIECPHCGNPLPLSAPSQTVLCCECLNNVVFDGHIWGKIFEQADMMLERLRVGASERERIEVDGIAVSFEVTNMAPACEKCAHPFNVESLENSERNFACPQCGDPACTWPAPEWIKKIYPGLTQIYEVEPGNHGGDNQPLVSISEVPRPVALNCPSCAANLKITYEHKRVSVKNISNHKASLLEAAVATGRLRRTPFSI